MICVIGLKNSGKSCIAQYLLKGEFKKDSPPTIGINFDIILFNGVKIQIGDFPGFDYMVPFGIERQHLWDKYSEGIYKIGGLIYVFDLYNTIDKAVAIKNFLEKVVKNRYVRNTPILVLGNKIDKFFRGEEDKDKEGRDFLHNIKRLIQITTTSPKSNYNHFLVSAKTGMNITDAFDWLINEITKSNC